MMKETKLVTGWLKMNTDNQTLRELLLKGIAQLDAGQTCEPSQVYARARAQVREVRKDSPAVQPTDNTDAQNESDG
jgi:hypothetical protein